MLQNDNSSPRKALQIDPLRTCQPLGAIYAALGVHACLPLSHGSPGCIRYQKELIGKHFQKNIRVASSMLKETAAIFGGKENLVTAVNNVFTNYNPEIIAVHTTCLSETIGDDMQSIISDIQLPGGKFVVYAKTPSYISSHITGYSAMVEAFINQMTIPGSTRRNKAFVIPGFINPGDVREIKRIASLYDGEFSVFPDVSEVFNVATPVKVDRYANGGTPAGEIISAGECRLVISLGSQAAQKGADTLAAKCGMESAKLDLPIGVEATDRFIDTLCRFYQKDPSPQLLHERRQLIDLVLNAGPNLYKKKAAVYCDPDISLPLCEFLAGMGVIPAFVFTGPDSKDLESRLRPVFSKYGVESVVKCSTDLFDLEEYLKDTPVDLLIGDVHGKRLARRLDIPLVRLGFPVTDRFIYPYLPIVGYQGAVRLLQMLLDALMEKYDRDCSVDELKFIL
jgi:nitrogenase molybdenum-iron protein beta chain